MELKIETIEGHCIKDWSMEKLREKRVFTMKPGEWPVGRSVLQHTCVLAIPQISRNYLHLSISESDLHLLGIATDEWLKLWSSPSRPDEHTYKCKRYRNQKHINGVP